jgi:hypothetical protein
MQWSSIEDDVYDAVDVVVEPILVWLRRILAGDLFEV